MKDIGIALIGFGGMGQKYAAILGEGQIPGLSLKGICCRNEAGQQKIRSLYPEASVYKDMDDTFAHEAEFDAVLIVTPHSTHVETAKRAFACGKHVFCEKPLGASAVSVRELLAAKKENTEFAVMFNNRTLPAFKKAKELLGAGTLGHVTRAVWVCNNWFRSPAYHKSAPWRSSWSGEQGGLLINQCHHYLDIWQWLFGMPEAVDADIDFGKYNDFDVDDSVELRFLYKKNGQAPAFRGTMISASGEHPGVNRLEIWGTNGRLTIHDGKRLEFEKNAVDTDTFNRENTEIYASPAHSPETVLLEEETNPYVAMFRNFSDHLHHGAPLIAPGEEGLNAVLLTNGAYLSAWAGRRISFPMDERLYEAELEKRKQAERN
ncbi:MAG: Gfo/Idh/MocA family oxidoreductase [Eubacteriales bacterium]|nr:Gfo/Idh/MocA family oxidoreductase [Eubacteriales bacterium]